MSSKCENVSATLIEVESVNEFNTILIGLINPSSNPTIKVRVGTEMKFEDTIPLLDPPAFNDIVSPFLMNAGSTTTYSFTVERVSGYTGNQYIKFPLPPGLAIDSDHIVINSANVLNSDE